MAVIVFANSKGGAGKTTSAFLLASELAERGSIVRVIDGDPNFPIASWQKYGGNHDNLSVVANKDEDTIIENIEEGNEDADFVIVDLEGTANLAVAYAISMADIVVVPTQRSQLDANEAAKAVSLVKKQEKVSGRSIPVSILLTKTSPAIRSKGLKRMADNMQGRGIDTFDVEIHEREAFKAVFDYSCTLSQLTSSQVSAEGLKKARENAAGYAAEAVRKLQKAMNDKKENAA